MVMEQNQPMQKIVVVEDNKALAEIYKTRLELLGYTCFVANDGIAALYLIQNELPHLVLLDLMVPNVAGDEILKRMRASDWGKNIPVFIISNLNETDAPAGLRELNIVGYVVKANLSDDGLDKIVNSILRPTENPQSAPPTAEPLVVTPEPSTPAVPPAAPAEPLPSPASPAPDTLSAFPDPSAAAEPMAPAPPVAGPLPPVPPAGPPPPPQQ